VFCNHSNSFNLPRHFSLSEYVNTTTCDTNADYAYIAFTSRACIQIDNSSFVPGCVDGELSSSSPQPLVLTYRITFLTSLLI